MKNVWNAPEPAVAPSAADTTILLIRHTIQHLLAVDTDNLSPVEMAQLAATIDDFIGALGEIKAVVDQAHAKATGTATEEKEPWL